MLFFHNCLSNIFKPTFLADLHTHGTIFLEEITKNNVKYFQIKSVDVDVDVKDIHVNVGSLFGGDGVVGEF